MGGSSLVVQWLRLYVSTTGGTGSILGQGTKVPHAMWCGQNKAVGIQRWRSPVGGEQGHWGLSQGFTEDLAFVCKFKNGWVWKIGTRWEAFQVEMMWLSWPWKGQRNTGTVKHPTEELSETWGRTENSLETRSCIVYCKTNLPSIIGFI